MCNANVRPSRNLANVQCQLCRVRSLSCDCTRSWPDATRRGLGAHPRRCPAAATVAKTLDCTRTSDCT